VLYSTADTAQGRVSRIVPQFEKGTIITCPRAIADHIVTEYGIARLLGKTDRQRAEELISIAHPDFRAELRREAQRMLYP
jgi:4-hydroxybutyrate CoA-transferase